MIIEDLPRKRKQAEEKAGWGYRAEQKAVDARHGELNPTTPVRNRKIEVWRGRAVLFVEIEKCLTVFQICV